jgi:hypothetical protein
LASPPIQAERCHGPRPNYDGQYGDNGEKQEHNQFRADREPQKIVTLQVISVPWVLQIHTYLHDTLSGRMCFISSGHAEMISMAGMSDILPSQR